MYPFLFYFWILSCCLAVCYYPIARKQLTGSWSWTSFSVTPCSKRGLKNSYITLNSPIYIYWGVGHIYRKGGRLWGREIQNWIVPDYDFLILFLNLSFCSVSALLGWFFKIKACITFSFIHSSTSMVKSDINTFSILLNILNWMAWNFCNTISYIFHIIILVPITFFKILAQRISSWWNVAPKCCLFCF